MASYAENVSIWWSHHDGLNHSWGTVLWQYMMINIPFLKRGRLFIRVWISVLKRTVRERWSWLTSWSNRCVFIWIWFVWESLTMYCDFWNQIWQSKSVRNLSLLVPGQIRILFCIMDVSVSRDAWTGAQCNIIKWKHDDVIKWKHFPRYWPFVRGIRRSPVNSPHKGQWRWALMFSLICVWINGWVNIRDAGDLRRYRAHYDVTVMSFWWWSKRKRHIWKIRCKITNCLGLYGEYVTAKTITVYY